MYRFHPYSFPDAKNVVVCVDIHGEFNAVVFKMCVQYQMKNTLLIVAGDCGFGFDKPGYYENVYRRNSSRLSKSNNWVVMIRGNHDDPAYFNEERISHQRFRTIPDYGIIQACGHNILCIGGAISIDRDYRRKHDSRHSAAGVASYWPDETPVYDEAALDNICRDFKIDTVVTHTAPSFCELISKNGLAEWAAVDPDIPADCENERKTMDRIFEHLKYSGQSVTHWYYGHFHQSWHSEIDGILFSMLDIMEFKEVPLKQV